MFARGPQNTTHQEVVVPSGQHTHTHLITAKQMRKCHTHHLSNHLIVSVIDQIASNVHMREREFAVRASINHLSVGVDLLV